MFVFAFWPERKVPKVAIVIKFDSDTECYNLGGQRVGVAAKTYSSLGSTYGPLFLLTAYL